MSEAQGKLLELTAQGHRLGFSHPPDLEAHAITPPPARLLKEIFRQLIVAPGASTPFGRLLS